MIISFGILFAHVYIIIGTDIIWSQYNWQTRCNQIPWFVSAFRLLLLSDQPFRVGIEFCERGDATGKRSLVSRINRIYRRCEGGKFMRRNIILCVTQKNRNFSGKSFFFTWRNWWNEGNNIECLCVSFLSDILELYKIRWNCYINF